MPCQPESFDRSQPSPDRGSADACVNTPAQVQRDARRIEQYHDYLARRDIELARVADDQAGDTVRRATHRGDRRGP